MQHTCSNVLSYIPHLSMIVHLGSTSPLVGVRGISRCTCIVHATFSGAFRSDVTCSVCHTVSTVYDPFLDLSIPTAAAGPAAATDQHAPPLPHRHHMAMMRQETKDTMTTTTLDGTLPRQPAASFSPRRGISGMSSSSIFTIFHALDAFTQPETVTAHCSSCSVSRECIKQLSIKTLPNVLCLHFKV